MPVETMAMKNFPSKRASRAILARSQTATLRTIAARLLHAPSRGSPFSDAIVGAVLCPAGAPRILESRSHGERRADDSNSSPGRSRVPPRARRDARDPLAEASHAGDRDRGEAPRPA